jgi:hypothetical protein
MRFLRKQVLSTAYASLFLGCRCPTVRCLRIDLARFVWLTVHQDISAKCSALSRARGIFRFNSCCANPSSLAVKTSGQRRDPIIAQLRTFDLSMTTALTERIGGNLTPMVVHRVFEKMRHAPTIRISEALEHRANLAFEVLDPTPNESTIWQCLDTWLEVREE